MKGKKRSLAAADAADGTQANTSAALRLTPTGRASSRSAAPEGSLSSNPVRIYADGIFDLFHIGHMRALEQAKKLFPNTYLIVGCCSDVTTHAYKGKTVMTDEERYEALRHCKWVDEVVRDAPWVITIDFLDKHNIDYVAHDDLPYADASGQTDDVYGIVKRAGRFKATQRTEGISTSDIILRILRDYNEYVMRNLSRGYTRKQLGISLVKEQRIRASANMRKLSQRLKEQRLGVADKIKKRMRLAGSSFRSGSPSLPSGRGSPSDLSLGRATPSRTGTRLTLADALELRGRELVDMLRRNGEELAQNVEQVVDKVIKGQVGRDLQMATGHMDRMVAGFMRVCEDGYTRIEAALNPWRRRVVAKGKGKGGPGAAAVAAAAAGGVTSGDEGASPSDSDDTADAPNSS